jgi:hypothetical protein
MHAGRSSVEQGSAGPEFEHSIGSPVGGPHSLGEIREAAAVGKASAAAPNFLRVPSAPREPMAMALTQAPRTGALVPMGVGVARLFLKKF